MKRTLFLPFIALAASALVTSVLAVNPALAQKGPSPADTSPPDTSSADSLPPLDPINGVTLSEVTPDANSLALAGLRVSVVGQPSTNDEGMTTPVFTVTHESGAMLTYEGEDSFFDWLPVTLQIAPLDPEASQPVIVTTSYTGGAHCCSDIDAVVWDDDANVLVHIPFATVDGGYSIEDANGDGVGEIQVADQSFLYTFDSYAGSWPPPRFFALRGTEFVDVSDDPSFVPAFDLAMEDMAPEDHRDRPGMLAGWAALEARQGRGDAALTRLAQIDVETFFDFQICANGGPNYECADKALRPATYQEFLRAHLIENGYLEATP